LIILTCHEQDNELSTLNSSNKPKVVSVPRYSTVSPGVSNLESPLILSDKNNSSSENKNQSHNIMSMKSSSALKLHELHASKQRVLIASSTKQEFELEKKLVNFHEPTENIQSLTTSLWGTVKHVDWAAMAA
jgi:hypothetical protein